MIRISDPKNEMPIGGLNSSSSKTNRTSRIKNSNLEAPGLAVLAPKDKLGRFRKFHYGDKNSETTKATELKFEAMISLYMKLCTCNFGGAPSRGLGQMHPKLVIAKFVK